MWVLIIIISAIGMAPTGAVVHEYKTLKDCEDERIRITAEMDKAYMNDGKEDFYPSDESYTLVCKEVRKVQT